MAQPYQDKTIHGAVELLQHSGFDALAEAVTVLLNSAMVAERSEHLNAGPWERSVEMYVQGVSTRRVKRIVEELCGMEVSSSQVSRAAAELYEMLEAWRSRELGRYRYILLDAQYEKVRQGGQVLDAAVLPGSVASSTCSRMPASHRRRLRTTNLVERLNKEIRRRTRVARLFPNEGSCLRLVSAVLMEISEDWQSAERRSVTFNNTDAIGG